MYMRVKWGETTYTIKSTPEMTIEEFREKAARLTKNDKQNVMFMYGGKQLKNHQTFF